MTGAYLEHLDGLRAVALAGVLLFHFEVPGASGGFLGVDCFLVLSGFLITRNLLASIEDASFSFRQFYTRRFWRLYPSSFITSAIAALAAYAMFPPDLALRTAESAVSSMALISNLYFFNQADYFDQSASLKPLLHTWSLSLEEQFYLFWPLILSLCVRGFGKSRSFLALGLSILSVFSFCLASYLHRTVPSFVFFMLPCRLYEFGSGALCALTEHIWSSWKYSILSSNAISVLSLLAVLFSFFGASEQASPAQMLPVVAAMCVLIATPNTLLSQLLSNQLLRYLGRLTYAGYLTHWPIFVFLRYFCQALHLQSIGSVGLICLTLLSGLVLQSAVENPLRTRDWKRRIIFFCIALPLGFFCVWGLFSNGWQFRERNDKTGSIQTAYIQSRKLCIESPNIKPNKMQSFNCTTGAARGSTLSNIIVVGDSFSRHLIPAFNQLGKKQNMRFIVNFKSACPLVARADTFLETRPKANNRDACISFHHQRWKLIQGESVEGFEGFPRNSTIVNANFNNFESLDDRKRRLKMLENDIRAAGHRLVIVGDPPGLGKEEYWRYACLDFQGTPIGRLFTKLGLNSAQAQCVKQSAAPRRGAAENSRDFKIAVQESLNRTTFVDLYSKMCVEAQKGRPLCKVLCQRDNRTHSCTELGYTRDAKHLTVRGSRLLLPYLQEHIPWT